MDAESPPTVATRHPQYYIEDGNIVFLVEDVLFRVHRYHLRKHSPVFESMLTLPQTGTTAEGTSDENPIVLPQIKSSDFASLMWMIYDERYDTDPTSSRSASKWHSILALSHLWDMASIRKVALDALSSCSPPLDPIEKLSICSLFSIEKTWALDAFVSLAKRTSKLTIAEGRKIGVDCTVILADAREELAMTRSLGQNLNWMQPGMAGSAGSDAYEKAVRTAIRRAEKGSADTSPTPSHQPFNPVAGIHAHWFPPDYSGNALGLVSQN